MAGGGRGSGQRDGGWGARLGRSCRRALASVSKVCDRKGSSLGTKARRACSIAAVPSSSSHFLISAWHLSEICEDTALACRWRGMAHVSPPQSPGALPRHGERDDGVRAGGRARVTGWAARCSGAQRSARAVQCKFRIFKAKHVLRRHRAARTIQSCRR